MPFPPGHPDGPPLEEREQTFFELVVEKLGIAILLGLMITGVTLFFVGAWWAIFWLLANMPTP